MNDYITSWLKENAEHEVEFRREQLIIAVSEIVCERLEEKKISRASLATKLKRSAAYVSQLLRGSRNMTLATLSDLALALDSKVKIELVEKDSTEGWDTYYAETFTRVRPQLTRSACNDGSFRLAKVTPMRACEAA